MRTPTVIIALATLLAGCATAPLAEAPEYSGKATDTAVVWNGFRHDWGYNHRLNRLGNWVGPLSCTRDGCGVEMGHAAASGLGSDVATWSGAGTAVHAPGVGFLPGVTTFEIHEPRAEGHLIEQVQTVTLPAEGLLADRGDYHVLLQGYDVMALADADMLIELGIEAGPVSVDREAGTLSFDVSLEVVLDCDAIECDGTWDVGGKARRAVDYGVHVMWMVVAAEPEQASVDCEGRTHRYAWYDEEPSDELQLDDVAVHGKLATRSRGALRASSKGVLGVQALSLRLDHESHFVSIATGVRPGVWNPVRGEAEYDLDVFFKQWNEATWENSVSFTTSGIAWTGGTVCLVTLHDAEVAPVRAEGSVTWTADGRPGTDESAVDRVAVTLPNLNTRAK